MSGAVHWTRLQTVCATLPAQLSRLCWRVDCLETFHHQGWGSWKSSTSKISIWQRSDILYKQGQILFFVICIKMFRLVFIVYFASLSSHHTPRFEILCINFIHSRFIKTNKEWEIFFIKENRSRLRLKMYFFLSLITKKTLQSSIKLCWDDCTLSVGQFRAARWFKKPHMSCVSLPQLPGESTFILVKHFFLT